MMDSKVQNPALSPCKWAGMFEALHDLIVYQAMQRPDHVALVDKTGQLSYADAWLQTRRLAAGLKSLGLQRNDRVAVFLEKRFETVLAFFAASAAGGVFVPVNPVLRPAQVAHIANDCAVKILVTSPERLEALSAVLAECPTVRTVVLVGDAPHTASPGLRIVTCREIEEEPVEASNLARPVDCDR